MDKVKVSKEVARAIESALNNYKGNKDRLLQEQGHVKRTEYNCYWSSDREPLNNLSTLQLAEILVRGYEVEKTPHEHIYDIFTEHAFKYNETKGNHIIEGYHNGYCDGITETLNILGITVEGVND